MSTLNRSTLGLGLGDAVKRPAGADAEDGATAAAPYPHLDNELQAMIGRQLSAIYHEILTEPVPDRFIRLLDELARKDASNP